MDEDDLIIFNILEVCDFNIIKMAHTLEIDESIIAGILYKSQDLQEKIWKSLTRAERLEFEADLNYYLGRGK